MISVVFKKENDRWIKGDKYIRPIFRQLLNRTPSRRSGMEKVVDNFLKGLDQLGIEYSFNKPGIFTKTNEKIISFGMGKLGLAGIKKSNPVIAAIGFPYPGELPLLCEDYNIKKFLQHSEWVLDYARSANLYPEDIFDIWFAGIDSDEWRPFIPINGKPIDVLIYSKIHWGKEQVDSELLQPIKDFLSFRKLSYQEIVYGGYNNEDFKRTLSESKVMIFLSAHESQGIAYQECLSSDVPVLAWDQGMWLDPERFKYDKTIVPATSVPFFDERCGMKFKDLNDFKIAFEVFFEKAISGVYSPREYILENLTIIKSTEKMLEIYNSI